MSWLLMEKLLRHQQSVRSCEGCCVDRLNSPPQSDRMLHCREATRWAMYGRRPRCKRNLTFCEAFGCSHVSGLFSHRGLPRCDAAAMAAGPDVIR